MIPVQLAWCRETSADPENWSDANPALGQCAVTALVVQDVMGGSLLRATTHSRDGAEPVGSHYWNQLRDSTWVDLTRQQFAPNVVLGQPEERFRDYLLSHPDTVRRYVLLQRRMGLLIPQPSEVRP